MTCDPNSPCPCEAHILHCDAHNCYCHPAHHCGDGPCKCTVYDCEDKGTLGNPSE